VKLVKNPVKLAVSPFPFYGDRKKKKRDPPVAFESSPIPVDSLAMVGGKNPLRFEPVIHSLRPGAGNSKSIHLDGSLPTSLPKKLPTTCHTIRAKIAYFQ
jgi:hypothetical protein